MVGISKEMGGGMPMDYKLGFRYIVGGSGIDFTKKKLRKDVLEKWDIEKVLITHGDNVYYGGKEYFERFVDNL